MRAERVLECELCRGRGRPTPAAFVISVPKPIPSDAGLEWRPERIVGFCELCRISLTEVFRILGPDTGEWSTWLPADHPDVRALLDQLATTQRDDAARAIAAAAEIVGTTAPAPASSSGLAMPDLPGPDFPCVICDARRATDFVVGERAAGGICATCRDNLAEACDHFGGYFGAWQLLAIERVPRDVLDQAAAG